MILALVALLAAFALPPAPARAGERLGYATFTPPDGWERSEHDRLVSFRAPGGRSMIIVAVDRIPTTSEEDLLSTFAPIVEENRPLSPRTAAPRRMTLPAGPVLWQVRNLADGGAFRTFVVSVAGGRGTVALLHADTLEEAGLHGGTFVSLLMSLRLDPPPEPQPQRPEPQPQPPQAAAGAQPGDGGLDGLFMGVEQRGWVNPYTQRYEIQFIEHVFRFFPDGRLLRGVPVDEGGGIDYPAECARRKAYHCGRYAVADGRLTMRLDDGSTWTELLTPRADGGFDSGRFQLFPAPPLGDPTEWLRGRWVAGASVEIGDGAGVTGLATSVRMFEWPRNRVVCAMSSGGGATTEIGSSASSATDAKGYCHVYGNHLSIHDRMNQRWTQYSLARWPGTEDVVLIGEQRFTRRD
jgi:hypothetical protein